MKKYFSLFVIASFLIIFAACESGKKSGEEESGTPENTEAAEGTEESPAEEEGPKEGVSVGDTDDSGEKVAVKDEFEGFISFTANGNALDCRYVETNAFKPNALDYKPSVGYSLITMQRSTSEGSKELIKIALTNYDPAKLSYPFTIPVGAQTGKMAQLTYEVKAGGKTVRYDNQNNFNVTLTGFSGGYLEGEFSGEATNPAGEIVKIEAGKFRIKLKENQLPA